jgi:hypothetical protein
MWTQNERNAALFDIRIVFSTSMPAIGSFVLLWSESKLIELRGFACANRDSR